MPRIICHTCGREVYATAPIEQLFADERRCPRCGAPLQNDRRVTDRRQMNRRENPSAESGPTESSEEPGPTESSEEPGPTESSEERGPTESSAERRGKDRREDRRRGADSGPNRRSSGWLE